MRWNSFVSCASLHFQCPSTARRHQKPSSDCRYFHSWCLAQRIKIFSPLSFFSSNLDLDPITYYAQVPKEVYPAPGSASCFIAFLSITTLSGLLVYHHFVGFFGISPLWYHLVLHYFGAVDIVIVIWLQWCMTYDMSGHNSRYGFSPAKNPVIENARHDSDYHVARRSFFSMQVVGRY